MKTIESQNEKSITFLMPGSGKSPRGGYKIIFEQANRLVQNGWKVFIAYPVHTFIRRVTLRNILGMIKRYLTGFLFGSYKARWFDLDNRIIEKKVFSLKYRNMPGSNYYCATSLETSYYLNDYPIPSRNKIYYIQGYETWNVPEPYTSNSYKFDMKKIAIAPYLVEKVKQAGGEVHFIPNGFDFTAFGLDTPIEKRNSHIAMMMYASNNDIKRCSDMIAAFKKVKNSIADLKVLVFGVPPRPADLPEWFEYHQQPKKLELRKLYNTASLFVAASRTEGFSLPPGEALICGCALCCTDIDGYALCAIEGKNALKSPVFDIDKLAENIEFLMTHNDVRIRFAKTGNELMKQFTWESAFGKFLEVIDE